ncbi:extracellular solute-binding protein [Devosia algicola]|uniref:Extracellular solute-binding protein n=1 Tax=Devosia algicola TaxID=3026418 RepID=A0ABY7YR09_9HYPH|nr:extracellular solute-binding protein [Devosia algicola]WDR03490.1 extracellular solute-binding protein [Devosia algicola]
MGLAVLVSAMMAGTMVPPAAAQDLSGEIRFSWWGSTVRNAKAESIISMFEKANPGVKVSREPGEWGSYWDKLTVQSASGNQPCAITMQSRWLAQYADPSILQPLDDKVASGELDVTGIDSAVLDSGRGSDGNLYFIPHGVFYFTLFMNKTAIEDAGMELPPDDWTWDDYAQYARDLSDKLPEGSYAVGNQGGAMDTFTDWVQSHGETLFTPEGEVGFTKQTVVDYFDFWEALRKDGVTETADQMAEIPDNIIDDTLLANGKILIDARPANQVDGHQKVLDAAMPGQELVIHSYPVGPSGTGEDIGSNGLAIGATCDENGTKLTEAWINFFTENPDAAATYSSDNGVVSVDRFRTAQLENPDTTPGQYQAVNMLSTVGPRAKSAYFPSGGYSALSGALTSAYETVAFEQSSSADAADKLIAQVKRLVRD